LPQCHCHPIALIITERQNKKNGEKPLSFDDFTFLILTYFQLICYFLAEPVIGDIAAHRVIFAPPPLPSDRVDLNRAAKKKAR
jgi:hypothetical protein